MEQETQKRLSRTEFEALCQEACEWMTPAEPEGERKELLWRQTYIKVEDRFDIPHFLKPGENRPDWSVKLEEVMRNRKVGEYDPVEIASKYINDTLKRLKDAES
ncbi:MAG TPA: hypothetical protein VHU19_10000 [Pyrinomonadaceae bacterium]|jgi:hypothetical protein|nr:hypothetical protein [Pyrinomonadaceae bacterium]